MDNSKILDEIIKYEKNISIEKYIDICLYSKNGYYKNLDVIGRKGDFITSSEISQLFGEIIGLFILDYWQTKINKPFNLIELGPGSGTLISDILRVTKKFKNFNESAEVNLVESNLAHIKKQKKNISSSLILNKKINWSRKFHSNNPKPVIIIANEFFDCFPIRQFYKKNNYWYEKNVQFNANKNKLELFDDIVVKTDTLKKIMKYKPINVLEFSRSREKYFSEICQHIRNVGGTMIVIDYGYVKKLTNFTLQSIYNNKKSHILDNIGNQDITSLVDFEKLIAIVKKNKLVIDLFTTQRNFLLMHGIIERFNKFLPNLTNKDEIKMKQGLDRITNKQNMGSFKVLIISKK